MKKATRFIILLQVVELILVFHQVRFKFFNFSVARRVKYVEELILKWVREQDVLLSWPKEYCDFLNSVRNVINPSGKAGKIVYYPGIGPHGVFLDLVTPLLAADCDTIVSVDLGSGADISINLDSCKKWVEISLAFLIKHGLISKDEIKTEYKADENKFICTFPFKGRERKLIVYYKKNAGEFFPPELENGFDVLITRWVPYGMVIDDEMAKIWLQKMRKPGYIITSGAKSYKEGERDLKISPGFWDGFEVLKTDYLGAAPRVVFFLKGDN